jgi:inosose dehydratase
MKWGTQLGSQWYNTTFKASIDYTKKAGFEGVDLTGYYGAWRNDVYSVFGWGPKGKEKFKEYLDTLGLQLAGIYLVYNYHEPQDHNQIMRAVNSACEFLESLRSQNLILGTALWSGGRKRDTTDNEMKTMADIFNEIGEVAKTHSLQASVHPHYDGYIETKEEFAEILDLTDPELVGACPDVGWHYLAGDDPAEVIRSHANRIVHLHLKDTNLRGSRGGSPFTVRYWWPLGRGKIDFEEIMRILKRVNYNGWVTVETEGSETPYEDAVESKKYIDEILSKIYI